MKKVIFFAICIFLAQSTFAQQQFAPFTVQTLDGKAITIPNDETITVFCSWDIKTEEVLKEAETLNALVKKYEGQPIQFIAVNGAKEKKVRTYLDTHPFLYQQLGGKEGKRINKVLGNSGLVQTYPKHLVVDKEGRVVQSAVGSCTTVHELIEQAIQN